MVKFQLFFIHLWIKFPSLKIFLRIMEGEESWKTSTHHKNSQLISSTMNCNVKTFWFCFYRIHITENHIAILLRLKDGQYSVINWTSSALSNYYLMANGLPIFWTYGTFVRHEIQ